MGEVQPGLLERETERVHEHDHDTFRQTFGTKGRFPYFLKTFGGPGGQGASGVVVVGRPAGRTEEGRSAEGATSI